MGCPNSVVDGLSGTSMSVVFGYRQLEGALVGADCRITIRCPPKPDLHVDAAQKILALTPQTVLGFAGDFEVARTLIEDIRSDLHGPTRRDPVSLLRRLPRFFRAKYGARPGWAVADRHVESCSIPSSWRIVVRCSPIPC